jgi:uncharacterized membrane protein
MKNIVAVFVLGAAAFTAKDSFAWFKICNAKTNGANMWVTYANYVSSEHALVASPMCYDGVTQAHDLANTYGSCSYSAWRNTGWWYLTPNNCATVDGNSITNSWSYIYADMTDGTHLNGANVPFQVVNPAFEWDQYSNLNGSNCVESAGGCDYSGAWTVETVGVNTGNYSNYTLSIH